MWLFKELDNNLPFQLQIQISRRINAPYKNVLYQIKWPFGLNLIIIFTKLPQILNFPLTYFVSHYPHPYHHTHSQQVTLFSRMTLTRDFYASLRPYPGSWLTDKWPVINECLASTWERLVVVHHCRSCPHCHQVRINHRATKLRDAEGSKHAKTRQNKRKSNDVRWAQWRFMMGRKIPLSHQPPYAPASQPTNITTRLWSALQVVAWLY